MIDPKYLRVAALLTLVQCCPQNAIHGAPVSGDHIGNSRPNDSPYSQWLNVSFCRFRSSDFRTSSVRLHLLSSSAISDPLQYRLIRPKILFLNLYWVTEESASLSCILVDRLRINFCWSESSFKHITRALSIKSIAWYGVLKDNWP